MRALAVLLIISSSLGQEKMDPRMRRIVTRNVALGIVQGTLSKSALRSRANLSVDNPSNVVLFIEKTLLEMINMFPSSLLLIFECDPLCNPFYVRWPRVRLNFKAVASSRLSLRACEKACSLGEDPQTPGRSLECAALNHHPSPDGFAHHCDVFQPHQLQNVDGYVEADDRYSFYWKYCLNTLRKCGGEYAFTYLSDRYMDARDVTRVTKKGSLEDCLLECLEEKLTTCRSISFNRTDGGCHISADSQLTKPQAIHLNNNPNFRIDYYENNCYNMSDNFKFEEECQIDGIRVKVKSKFPYTGALYGLYDFFTCRIEPKGTKEFEYLFPSPTKSRNCSDSIRFQTYTTWTGYCVCGTYTGSLLPLRGFLYRYCKCRSYSIKIVLGDQMILDVVLSTDGIEPLYFITPDDLTYQAKCPINSAKSGTGSDNKIEEDLQPKTSRTIIPVTKAATAAKAFASSTTRPTTWTTSPFKTSTTPTTTTSTKRTTTRTSISTTTKTTTTSVATSPTAAPRIALNRSPVVSTVGPPSVERPSGPPTKPSNSAVSFDIFHNGQPVEAVVVGTKITLSFAPLYAIPPEHMSVRECQVEPIDSKYEWEREPLPIIRDGCQADLVGLVCPPKQSEFGVKVTVESFRYQSTPHVQYSCLVRICAFAPCPMVTCPPVDGCPQGKRVIRGLSFEEIRRALEADPKLASQIGIPPHLFANQRGHNVEQQLLALGGDYTVKRRLVVVNSEDQLRYYVRTGDVS